MKLRPYQNEAVAAVLNGWEENPSTIIVLPTGTGKTTVFSEIIKRCLPRRSLVIAHREELIYQARERIELMAGIKCGIEMAEQRASVATLFRLPVVVATVQTLVRRLETFKPDDFGLLVIDECFPTGTLVDGIPIQNLRAGDMVRTFHDGVITLRPIVRTMKSAPEFMVDVRFASGRKMSCTGAHPFFTRHGWIPAALLTSCDMVLRCTHDLPMQTMRTARRDRFEVSSRPDQVRAGNFLRPAMCEGFLPDSFFANNGGHQPKVLCGADDEEQSHEARRSEGQSVYQAASHGVEANGAWREWHGTNDPTAGDGVRAWMGHGGSRENGWRERQDRAPHLLQTGRGQSANACGRRDRRIFPLLIEEEGGRSEEGGVFEWDWVDRVEIHKRGSGPGFERLCPEGVVFNLEVAEHHCYFAEGYLVHNCHHGVAGTYQKIIDYFRQNKAIRILGVTATPDRADEEALGQLFSGPAYVYEILDAINDGWLVPVEQQMVHIACLDYSHVRTTAGDLNGGDLAVVMEDEKNVQGVVGASIGIIGDRSTILFAASVRHAEMARDIFNRHRPGMAGFICGTTSSDERPKIMESFRSGATQVLCNVGIATEGVDLPNATVIIMGRPTKSRSLYAQMAGRALRPLAGLVDPIDEAEGRKQAIAQSAKPAALILDFVGNSGHHKLVSTADILGGKVSERAVEIATRQARKAGGPVNMGWLLDEAEKAEQRRIEQERQRQEEQKRAYEARKQNLVARVQYRSQQISPFEVLGLAPVRERGWDKGRILSEKQRNLLSRNGIDPDSISYTEGSRLVGEIVKRFTNRECTFKQAKLLKKHGYPVNISMSEASGIIDALAKNKWQRPVPA